MLHLHRSNHLERLADALAELMSDPLPDPMTPEIVVAQNGGMVRWLEQQLALRLDIAANLCFPLPARFFWQIFGYWLPELPREQEFSRDILQWRIFTMLSGSLSQPGFQELQLYLGNTPDAFKHYQLSARIADLFDQYLVYRPDMILGWDAGRDEHWQARLWRMITAKAGASHRAALWQQLRQALLSGQTAVLPLPQRVSFFGLTALAPAYLDLLHELAAHLDIHLFLCTPCRAYWADLIPEAIKARRLARQANPAEAALHALLDVGNPLLASMGHAGQEFHDLLLEYNPVEDDLFIEPPQDGRLLHELQLDLLDLRDRRTPDGKNTADRFLLQPDDLSLQIHSCHSPLREVQVLHDQLLQLFEQLPDLAPREVVVMAPDMERYASPVDAVFSTASEHLHIPWSIADRKAVAERPLLAAFLTLLQLPQSRMTAPELLDLLELPALRRRFGLNEMDLPRLRLWVEESGIRWGGNAGDRVALGLPAVEENTWEFGLRRLFLGYALPADQELFQDIAPYPEVEGNTAAALGGLQDFYNAVHSWRRKLSEPLPAMAWPERCNALLQDFFLAAGETEESQLQELRDAIQQLAVDTETAACDAPLPAALLARWLEETMSNRAVPGGYLGGRVTFCNMVPMRSLPFRVICLLGMNDTDFPRVQRPPGFDLMALAPRPGDRSRRRDDRYLFLEALFSARDVLYLSFVGRDIRDDSAREPSVLVSELLGYICSSSRFPGTDGAALDSRVIIVQHPLQPFSQRYFTHPASHAISTSVKKRGVFSYSAAWCAAADQESGAEAGPFANVSLLGSPSGQVTVSLDALLGFFADPAAAFLQQNFSIRPPKDEETLPAAESFQLSGLEGYTLRNELLERCLNMQRGGRMDTCAATAETFATLARARGLLPHGAAGNLEYRRQAGQAAELAQRLEAYPLDEALFVLDHPLQSAAEESLALSFRLSGSLPGQAVRAGLLGYRCGGLRAKDRLAAWILHLACSLLQPDTPRNYEAEQDKNGKPQTLAFAALTGVLAEKHLMELLLLHHRGLAQPLPFPPESSFALIKKKGGGASAQQAWEGDAFHEGEGAGFANSIIWRGQSPLSHPDFTDIAGTIWTPLLETTGEWP